MKLATKLKLMSKAKRLKEQLVELLPLIEIEERDISDEKMNYAVQLYDKITAIEARLPEVKIYREDAEIQLEKAFQAMEWFTEGRNPHLDAQTEGDWS